MTSPHFHLPNRFSYHFKNQGKLIDFCFCSRGLLPRKQKIKDRRLEKKNSEREREQHFQKRSNATQCGNVQGQNMSFRQSRQ